MVALSRIWGHPQDLSPIDHAARCAARITLYGLIYRALQRLKVAHRPKLATAFSSILLGENLALYNSLHSRTTSAALFRQQILESLYPKGSSRPNALLKDEETLRLIATLIKRPNTPPRTLPRAPHTGAPPPSGTHSSGLPRPSVSGNLPFRVQIWHLLYPDPLARPPVPDSDSGIIEPLRYALSRTEVGSELLHQVATIQQTLRKEQERRSRLVTPATGKEVPLTIGDIDDLLEDLSVDSTGSRRSSLRSTTSSPSLLSRSKRRTPFEGCYKGSVLSLLHLRKLITYQDPPPRSSVELRRCCDLMNRVIEELQLTGERTSIAQMHKIIAKATGLIRMAAEYQRTSGSPVSLFQCFERADAVVLERQARSVSRQKGRPIPSYLSVKEKVTRGIRSILKEKKLVGNTASLPTTWRRLHQMCNGLEEIANAVGTDIDSAVERIERIAKVKADGGEGVFEHIRRGDQSFSTPSRERKDRVSSNPTTPVHS